MPKDQSNIIFIENFNNEIYYRNYDGRIKKADHKLSETIRLNRKRVSFKDEESIRIKTLGGDSCDVDLDKIKNLYIGDLDNIRLVSFDSGYFSLVMRLPKYHILIRRRKKTNNNSLKIKQDIIRELDSHIFFQIYEDSFINMERINNIRINKDRNDYYKIKFTASEVNFSIIVLDKDREKFLSYFHKKRKNKFLSLCNV